MLKEPFQQDRVTAGLDQSPASHKRQDWISLPRGPQEAIKLKDPFQPERVAAGLNQSPAMAKKAIMLKDPFQQDRVTAGLNQSPAGHSDGRTEPVSRCVTEAIHLSQGSLLGIAWNLQWSTKFNSAVSFR